MTTQEISKAIQDFANDIDTYTSVHERQNAVFAESGGKPIQYGTTTTHNY